MKKVKKRFITNIIFNVIALISTIIAIVFCIYINKLDMIPTNYLTIAFIAIAVIYLILIGLTLPRKMKTLVKGICCFFFIANALVFAYGIKYSDKTIVIGTHGTALSSIFNYYDSSFNGDSFMKIIDLMPYIVKMDFEGKINISKEEVFSIWKEYKE